ncbi:hypothetical protein KC573_00295 [candidate division WWE3 bacterium]|uniref:Uncharacterized protein n=1 Tax=candidate division WWE3 bacterium TaxID=2053526 RepID=A0A955LV67_UNCKA|nr:hypothetical protein [candidate division WWE3 bacterium]
MDIQSGDILLCEGNIVIDDYALFRVVWRDPFENKWIALPCNSDGRIDGAEWHYIDDDLVALGKYEPDGEPHYGLNSLNDDDSTELSMTQSELNDTQIPF